MVRLQTLDLRIGVRVPASQPLRRPRTHMKIIPICACLLSGTFLFAQDPSDLFDKAPGPIDEALRARVGEFYQAFIAGKFRDAYKLVDDESQDAFMASDKNTYKSCETLKISYSDNFTKARVLESCQGEFRFHGDRFETKIPLTTNWIVVDGKWYWHFVKPTTAPSPFSPTGFVNIPQDQPTNTGNINIPKDPVAEARNILSKVQLDKTEIYLKGYETSKDELHVRNEMPGGVIVNVDTVTQPGVKVRIAKPELGPHEETPIYFEYNVDDASISCGECAKRIKGTMTVQVRITPTNQVFPIKIYFGVPPELEKQLPEEIRKQLPKH